MNQSMNKCIKTHVLQQALESTLGQSPFLTPSLPLSLSPSLPLSLPPSLNFDLCLAVDLKPFNYFSSPSPSVKASVIICEYIVLSLLLALTLLLPLLQDLICMISFSCFLCLSSSRDCLYVSVPLSIHVSVSVYVSVSHFVSLTFPVSDSPSLLVIVKFSLSLYLP